AEPDHHGGSDPREPAVLLRGPAKEPDRRVLRVPEPPAALGGMSVYVAGADIGSTTAKVVILDGEGKIAATSLGPTGASIVEAAQRRFKEAIEAAKIDQAEVEFVVGTGHG